MKNGGGGAKPTFNRCKSRRRGSAALLDRLHLDGQTKEVDKALGIHLIVHLVLAEGSHFLIIEGIRRSDA